MVCCLCGTLRDPEVRKLKRSVRLLKSSCSDITSIRAAAISIASGNRSSRSQILATGSRLPAATLNFGATSRARVSNSKTASGSRSDATGQRASPGTPRASRLVAMMWSWGQRSSSVWERAAHSFTRCSQLSRMSNAFLAASHEAATSWAGPRPGSSRVATTAPATSSVAASSIHHTPSGQKFGFAFATWAASRLLPAPPVPMRVTMRALPSSPLSERRSASRPTKLVRWCGSLVGAALGWRPRTATLSMWLSSPTPSDISTIPPRLWSGSAHI